MKKKLTAVLFIIIILFTFASCYQTDVIARASEDSFQEALNAADVEEDSVNNGWSIISPDEDARFIFSKDFSKSSMYDVMIEANAAPFIEAGLDTSKLPPGIFDNGKIIAGVNVSDESIVYEGDITPIETYKQIVALNRESIKYHAELDHFGIELMDGNMFEWAKDMDANDKDIVFVLNPQPFIDAGADVESIEGWLYAKVKTMDMSGKEIEVYKLLKPFNLK